ncbi:MAG: hypothetical protein ABI923_03140 [bacterium]
MSIPRRNFLKSATMTTFSAGLALGTAHLIFGQSADREASRQQRQGSGEFAIPMEAEQNTLFFYRRSTFRPYVGDIFQIPNALGEMITLKLIRVNDFKLRTTTKISTKAARRTDSFSLTFSATEPLPPFTSIHNVSHPALGEFDLFMTSHEADDGTIMYEATFNHI